MPLAVGVSVGVPVDVRVRVALNVADAVAVEVALVVTVGEIVAVRVSVGPGVTGAAFLATIGRYAQAVGVKDNRPEPEVRVGAHKTRSPSSNIPNPPSGKR